MIKPVQVTVTSKKGEVKEGTIMVPETLSELLDLVGERAVFSAALASYLVKSKRRLASGSKPRRKLLKLDLGSLSAEQKVALMNAGLLNPE